MHSFTVLIVSEEMQTTVMAVCCDGDGALESASISFSGQGEIAIWEKGRKEVALMAHLLQVS